MALAHHFAVEAIEDLEGELPDLRGSDKGTLTLAAVECVLGHQVVDGLADGGPADTEELGELQLRRQAFPGGDLTAVDAVLQEALDLVVEGRGGCPVEAEAG